MTLAILDASRILLAMVGVALAAYQFRLALGDRGAGWRGHLGVAIALMVMCGSRIQNLGKPMTWQFVGTALAVGLITWSVLRRRSDERSGQAVA